MRTTPPTTRIIARATILARVFGVMAVTRLMIAEDTGVAVGTISYRFGSMKALRDKIVDWAVENEDIKILADALAVRYPKLSRRLSPDLRKRIAAYFTR